MMDKLLEQIVKQTDLTQMWLTPKGKEEELTLPTHQEDVARRLDKDFQLPSSDSSFAFQEKLFYKFLKQTGYIRVAVSWLDDELNISVGGKVTSVQLAKIGKLVREHPSFIWELYIPQKKKWKYGEGFQKFVSALKGYDLLEARGHWRDWTEISCPECQWRTYRKTLRKSDPENILKTMKCPECGAKLEIRESIREGKVEKLEDEYQDLELEILQNQRGSYDVYMFGKIIWRNVLGLKFLEELLKKRIEESSIDFPQKDLDLDVWNKEGNIYTIKPEVKRKILDIINKYPDIDLVDTAAAGISDAATIHIVGSIATNQYLEDSDIDVHIVVSKDADFHGDEVFQSKVGSWFNENRDKINGYIKKHPIEIYLQYDPAQDLMSDGVYDLMADKWIIRPKIAPSNYDPYKDFSSIADDIRGAVQNADILLGELKRDVIDYDVIKHAVEKMTGEDKEHFLRNLQDKLVEIENDIKTLYSKRKEWVDMRHFASKPETPEQAMRDVALAKKWRDTNALFKFINRYKYLRVIKDLEKLLADDKISPWEIDTIKSIVGAG